MCLSLVATPCFPAPHTPVPSGSTPTGGGTQCASPAAARCSLSSSRQESTQATAGQAAERAKRGGAEHEYSRQPCPGELGNAPHGGKRKRMGRGAPLPSPPTTRMRAWAATRANRRSAGPGFCRGSSTTCGPKGGSGGCRG